MKTKKTFVAILMAISVSVAFGHDDMQTDSLNKQNQGEAMVTNP